MQHQFLTLGYHAEEGVPQLLKLIKHLPLEPVIHIPAAHFRHRVLQFINGFQVLSRNPKREGRDHDQHQHAHDEKENHAI